MKLLDVNSNTGNRGDTSNDNNNDTNSKILIRPQPPTSHKTLAIVCNTKNMKIPNQHQRGKKLLLIEGKFFAQERDKNLNKAHLSS